MNEQPKPVKTPLRVRLALALAVLFDRIPIHPLVNRAQRRERDRELRRKGQL